MKSFLVTLSIGLCLAVVVGFRIRRDTDDGDDDGHVDLTPTAQVKFCKTNDKRDGICVSESMCNEKLNIEVGGIIDDSELRIGTCPGKLDWCCVHPNMSMFNKQPDISTSSPPPPRGCRIGQKDSCPWCAAVYRDNPRTSSSELFCGGAIIGSRFVLTAASCALAHKRSDLWVRIPGSDRNYPVNSTVKHKQFNSGTREHDVALLLLNEDVEWPEGKNDGLGACLGLRTPLAGDCVAIGFDETDQLAFTPVVVTAGSCSDRGSSYDAACGRASGTCSVAPGSPVLCPSDADGLIMAGLVRQICVKDSTVLGALMQSSEWIGEELTKNTIAANRYTIIR